VLPQGLGESARLLGRAMQARAIEPLEAEGVEIEIGMLACQDDMRRQSDRAERVRDGSKLDGFGPGSNDKRNTTSAQLPP
jgi:hypothetical protein